MNLITRRVSLLRNIQRSVATLDTIQASYLKEPCIRVDDKDEPIEIVSKEACHRSPILHRAFSVFIFNRQQKMLLQKRSLSKITFPEVWTNACCSHPHYVTSEMETGSDFIGIRRAAARKLAHELGFNNVDTERMHVMGRFIYFANSDAMWCEHELDYAIVLTDFDEKPQPNPEEVSEVRYVDQTQLHSMMTADSNASRFSPWFQLFSKFCWLDIWWSNLNDLARHRDMQTIHRLN